MTAPVLVTLAVVWPRLLSAGPVAQLSPAIVAMFFLPGFLVLELAAPRLGRDLNPVERAPFLFCLSLGVWSLVAWPAFRMQLSSDLMIGGMLILEVVGLAAVWFLRGRDKNLPLKENGRRDPLHAGYFIALIVFVLLIAALVALSAEYQRYDFDSSTHIASYHKIAISDRIIGGNPFWGPEYSYIPHYVSNPWCLVVGLTARLGQTSVTWLSVYLAALLTILVFCTFYSLLKSLTRDDLISAVGTLLILGPWVSEMALNWGPPMGNFYLQFLPHAEPCAQLILFPLWLAAVFRFVREGTNEGWFISAALALSAMGVHPEPLFVIPLSIGLIMIVLFFMSAARANRLRLFLLTLFIYAAAAGIAYWITHPSAIENLRSGWVVYEKEELLRQFLKNSWVVSRDLFGLHPQRLLRISNILTILGLICLSLFALFKPTLLPGRTGARLPSLSLSAPGSSEHLSVAALAAVFIGPYLILYNPVAVPIIAHLLGSVIPLRLMEGFYEILFLTGKFGAVASALVLVLRSDFIGISGKWKSACVLILLVAIAAGSLGRNTVRSHIVDMINRDAVSILDLNREPLYQEMARLKPAMVSIEQEQSEYLAMTTPHHALSTTRAVKERQLDNEKIVRFDGTETEIQALLDKYGVNYIVVPTENNLVSNGDFKKSQRAWDPVSCTLESVRGGIDGNCLQMTALKSGSQFAYQNITCVPGRDYEISGYVKSGSSGDEPFAIQIFLANAAGSGEFTLEGKTSADWVKYSEIFRANDKSLCVMLRKKSSTTGTMFFDSIACREVKGNAEKKWEEQGPLERFRSHPELFREVLKLKDYAVFKYEKRNVLNAPGQGQQK